MASDTDHHQFRPLCMGDGAMAALIAAKDWSRTPLGPRERWPQSLRWAVDLCLGSRFPMHIWWGPELINIYNDGHALILGRRHPGALGKPAAGVWTEIWPMLAPEVEAVMARGESTWNERQHVVVERNGFREDGWFTWSYSPIRDEQGRVGGLMCVATEDTGRVLTDRERVRIDENQQRQRAEKLANTILESITDAFFSLDEEWRFTYMNAQGGRILGRPPGELIGKVIWDEYPGLHGSVFEPVYRRAMNERVGGAVTAFYPDHNCWYEVNSYPSPNGISMYFRNVSERVQLENEQKRLRREVEIERERLAEARDNAESANRAKDRFLAVLSHELRTPLSPVLMTLPVFELDPDMPVKFREDLAMVRRNIELEVKLIDDLLDISRVISGKLRLQLQPVQAHEVLKYAIHSSLSDTSGKHVCVRQSFDASNDRINADPARLQQVFWNLLRNAVKFSPPGGEISVRTFNPAGTQQLCVEVRDVGMGIDPELLPRIFDAFEQGDARMARQFGGLGLGLAIAKAVVEMHEGKITAASEGHGQGATFTVTISNAVASAADVIDRDAPPSTVQRAANARILLVEDHVDTARMLAKLLKLTGYEVTTAATAAAALQVASAQPFDVVLSDIGLPDATGYELMAQIRDRYGMKGIALTGYGMEDDLRRSREAGFLDHVVKPVNFVQLTAVIQRVVSADLRE